MSTKGPGLLTGIPDGAALRTQGVVSRALPGDVPDGGVSCQPVWRRVPSTSRSWGPQVGTFQARTLQSRHSSRNDSSSPHVLSEYSAPDTVSLPELPVTPESGDGG